MVLMGSSEELHFNMWSTLTWNHFLCVRKQCPLSNHPSHFSLILTPASSWRHEAPHWSVNAHNHTSHHHGWLSCCNLPCSVLTLPKSLFQYVNSAKGVTVKFGVFTIKEKSYHWFIHFCCCLRQQSHCVTTLSSNWDPPASASLMLDDKHALLHLAH